MIHEIVSSDVDFASGMLNSGHSDPEIFAYLASRGLDSAKASQLVEDLRHGRKPNPQLPFELRPAGHSAVGGRGTARTEPYQAQHSHRRRSGSRRHKGSAIEWWFLVLVAIASLALGYVLLKTGNQASTDAVNNAKHELPPAPGKRP